MDDREKENREHEEFLKNFHKRCGTESETAQSTPASNQPQRTGQKEPQVQNTDRTVPLKSETDECDRTCHINRQNGTCNAKRRIQPSREPKMRRRQPPRKLAARKRRQRQIKIWSAAVFAALILAVVLIVYFCTNGTDVLKGIWDLDGVTVYQFDGKGAGSLNLPSSSYTFTYEIKDGTLAIDFESEAAQDKTYTFTVEKNKLTLKESEGADAKIFELTKRED